MEIKRITKDDLVMNDETSQYEYKEKLQFDGHIEIDGDLGRVKFAAGVWATGHIWTKAGTGIEAGWGIEAGRGIEAGWGIEAGRGIKAGWGIEAGRGIKAGESIEAGWGIEAGRGIKAGWGIKAGRGIKAGESIEAGWGIVTFYSGGIFAKQITALRIAVGFNITEIQTITADVRKGVVILGTVKAP